MRCICCANGNDLPDGEWCRACGIDSEGKLHRILTNAYIFANGNIMAFDQFGQQMPEYQGSDAKEKIAKDYPNIRIEHRQWR